MERERPCGQVIYMSEFKIISDGSCDLSFEQAAKLNVDIIPFNIQFGEETFKEGVDISVRDFYNRLVENPGVFPKTSLPSINDYYEAFVKYAKEGIDIICLCITVKFSGSYNSAMSAKDLVLEEYPNAKIEVINTTVNTVLQGLIVKEACRLRDEGASFDRIVSEIEEKKSTGRIFFTIKDLSYLQHGGRIGKVASIIGNLLKISPLITLKDGEIFSSGKAISRGRSLAKVKEMLRDYINETEATGETYRLAVGYGYDYEEGLKFKESLEKEFAGCSFELEQIGATIACHTGPYPLGIGIVKKLEK